MDINVDGQRVVVTAGGAGIGRVIARTFHANGARVHVCDVDRAALDALAGEAPEIGVSEADVADPAAVDRLFDEAEVRLGGLDVLINNAGIAGPTGRAEEIAPADWDRTIAVNLSGQFYCARRAIPLLRSAGGGSIVNLSSSAGRRGFPLRIPYAASKYGVIGLTETLTMELGPAGIRVNAILPGPVEGPRIRGVIDRQAEAAGISGAEAAARMQRLSALRTFIDPQEVADLALYLCSPAGRHISGQSLGVCGGFMSYEIPEESTR